MIHYSCTQPKACQKHVTAAASYLAVGHAAALKPAVKHIVNAAQHALALAAGDGDVINEVTVQVVNLLYKQGNQRMVGLRVTMTCDSERSDAAAEPLPALTRRC
jgi:hypothetical protein